MSDLNVVSTVGSDLDSNVTLNEMTFRPKRQDRCFFFELMSESASESVTKGSSWETSAYKNILSDVKPPIMS